MVTAAIPHQGREHLHPLNLSSLPYNPNFQGTSQRMEDGLLEGTARMA